MLTEFSKLIRVSKHKYQLLQWMDVNIYVNGNDFSIHINIFNNKRAVFSKIGVNSFIFVLRIGKNKTTKEAKDPCIDYSYGNGSVSYLLNNKNAYYIDLRNGDHEADAWLEGNQIGMSIPLKNFKNPNQKNRI